MTSPCSVPPWLRDIIREETHEQQACCQEHDDDYRYGGDGQARAIADAKLLLGLLRAGMDWPLAEKYYQAVRNCGGSHWGHRGPWVWNEIPAPTEAP